MKVAFDGPTKTITVLPGVTVIDVRVDLFSAWKKWVHAGNSQWLPAFRAVGGDYITPSSTLEEVFFTINGWKIHVNQTLDLYGRLYNEDTSVSALVVASGACVRTEYAESSGGGNGATAQQIRQEIDANSVALQNIASAINNIPHMVRTELSPELQHLLTLSNSSLTPTQANMLLELYRIFGLDPTAPLVVTTNSRSAGSAINQTITTNNTQTTVTRI